MRRTRLVAAACLSAVAFQVDAATIDDVRDRGSLSCGVGTGVAGFSAPNSNETWEGFDVALCRAVAAAVLDDPQAVDFVQTTPQDYANTLVSGEVDMLVGHSSWTFSKDVGLKFDFAGVSYYDVQGFMVPRELGVTSAPDLEEPRVCLPER